MNIGADTDIQKFLTDYANEKKTLQGIPKFLWLWEDYLNTDRIEFIDRADFPIEKKIKIIKGLDIKNKLFGTYNKIFRYLEPLIEEVNRNEKRTFKILELAGGLGDLSIGLYEVANKKKKEFDILITGSDIIPNYVDISNDQVAAKNMEIEFKVIDAMSLSEVEGEKFDIVISLHSLHHFSPFEISKLIQNAKKVSNYGLFAVDGKRNFLNLVFMIMTALIPSVLSMNFMFLHDAIISGRKMYRSSFLLRLGLASSPDSIVESGEFSLGLEYLKVTPQEN